MTSSFRSIGVLEGGAVSFGVSYSILWAGAVTVTTHHVDLCPPGSAEVLNWTLLWILLWTLLWTLLWILIRTLLWTLLLTLLSLLVNDDVPSKLILFSLLS